MKVLSTEEAKKRFLDGENIWYCIDQEFEVMTSEEVEEERDQGNTIFVEHESESGVAQMTCIGHAEGDDEDSFNEDTHYFSEWFYYYCIHPIFKKRFLELYDIDDYQTMADEMAEWSHEEGVPMLMESENMISGMLQITSFTVSRLVVVGAIFNKGETYAELPPMESWIQQLKPIIKEYKDSSGNEPLTEKEINDLVHIIKCKISLHEGNIHEGEYERLLDYGYQEPLGFTRYSIIEKIESIRLDWIEQGNDNFEVSKRDIDKVVNEVSGLESIDWDGIEEKIREHFGIE